MSKNTDLIMQNKIFSWILIATALILTIPLVAMQFTDQVVWTFSDFVVMGTLIFGMGSLFILTARKMDKRHHLAVGILFGLMLLYIWVELAIGVFTNLGS